MKKVKVDDGYQIIAKWICIDVHKGGWWIRLYFFPFNGNGIRYKNLKYHSLSFSERNGYKKYLRIGNHLIKNIKNTL